MALTVQHVDTNHVQHLWPVVEPFIQSTLDKVGGSPEYNIHHVRAYVAMGQWVLLVAVDEEQAVHGAMTISFINYPQHRVAFVTTTGGKFIANPQLLEQLKAFVHRHGATKIQAFCRDSMVRLLEKSGFEPRNTLVEVTL